MSTLVEQVAWEYVDGLGLRPLSLGLPPGVSPRTFGFSPDYAQDRRVLVGATQRGTTGLQHPGIYECTGSSRCRRVATLGIQHEVPHLAMPATSGGPVLAWSTHELRRSDDGGQTFHRLPLPGPGPLQRIVELAAAPDGRVFASVERSVSEGGTWVSADGGDTWRLLESAGVLEALAALPDGRILAARRGDPGGVLCSVDDGATWGRRC